MSRAHDLTREVRRLKSAISAIHNHLHADDVNAAHQACECALDGGATTQPNLNERDSATAMDFAAAFNELATRYKVRASGITMMPSATVPGATSLQIFGEVGACRWLEAQLRGAPSTYMGDHAPASPR